MSKEAMKLALEALKRLDGWLALRYGSGLTPQEKEIVAALREALAQDVPEVGFGNMALDKMAENARELGLDYEPAQQEPFVTKNKSGITLHVGWDDLPFGTKLYTSPRRTWVGLTEEELDEMFSKTLKGKKLVNWVARAIEAKLKEKNT